MAFISRKISLHFCPSDPSGGGERLDLDNCSDGVEVAHDQHQLGGHPLEHVEHAVVKLADRCPSDRKLMFFTLLIVKKGKNRYSKKYSVRSGG